MVKLLLILGALGWGAIAGAASLRIDAWTSACEETGILNPLDCALPKQINTLPLTLELPVTPLAPGEVKVHKYANKFSHHVLALHYELRIYEVFPKVGIRYYQVQLEWISPARATCMLSVDATKVAWSPMTCVSVDQSNHRWGLNLSVGTSGTKPTLSKPGNGPNP